MKPALTVIALSVAVLASGCGSGGADPVVTPASSGGAAVSLSPSPTAEAAPPSAVPATSGPLTAADGTNLKACSDGRCEVIVEDGDSLPAISGLGTVTVLVTSDEVTLSKTTDGFSSTLTGTEGIVQQMDKQLFLIVAVRDGKAVLRLRKA